MTLSLTRDQALGWRLGRHLLGAERAGSAVEVVGRVLGLRAWPSGATDGAVAVRTGRPPGSEVDDALREGRLLRSYAWRGGSYLLTPDLAAHVLSARTANRVWTTRRFQAQGGFELDDWQPLREALRELLSDGPRTRAEIAAHLGRIPGLRHLQEGASGRGSDSLYKPLHWWGDIGFGPDRDGQATFRLVGDDLPPLPDAASAVRWLVLRYLGVYGPATERNLRYWLSEGLSVPSIMLQRCVADLATLGEVVEVRVDGAGAWIRAQDPDGLARGATTDGMLLLPAYDPWILGPGTADASIVPPEHRALLSRGGCPVVRRGAVVGTWRAEDGAPEITLWS